ncbi:MAG: aminotransferase class I/II-fold pyridoxal phosphate-dependent enzyme [Sphingomonadales bacterium]
MTGLKISKRSDIASFLALDVLKAANEREAAGGDILHMEIGEPCSGPPPAVNDAAARALRNGWTGYTEALGTAELRERIARDYRERHDLDVAPGQVIITTGSSAGFILSFLATFDVGDRVIIAEPGYPAYPKLLSALGIEPVVVHVGIEQDFKLTPALLEQALEKHGPVQGVLIASPANPTGTMLDEEELSAIVDFCRDARLRLISDEIYQDITFDRPAATALEYWDEAIVINSFSKYYRMTGWRIGWMVAPRALVRPRAFSYHRRRYPSTQPWWRWIAARNSTSRSPFTPAIATACLASSTRSE